ncbi:MAG: glycosyltransferase family 2 protein [Scytonematopsis contorta HA4267-MV1]|jgi:glycosyltransferase involved in cell wall biosynthesis|nr:glycosyltransferase family 2 protein [Scytonematopsis contorta HA4267-MV1]
MSKQLNIGVVIPSYNEGNDLIETLQAIFNQTSPFAEVIVVDDSLDGTEQLVQSTFGDKVKLVHRDSPQGRCSARNLGMQISTADVVVILNADVHLPPDFCATLKLKYSTENCDALGVELFIENTTHPYPRYLYAQHLGLKTDSIGWTEGFSVRRSFFLKTKGFPEGYPLSILAGEDAEWFFDLQRTGAKICSDFNLKVNTVMPEDWETIKSQIKGRASLRTWHFVYDKALLELLLRSIIKQSRRLFTLITVLPFILQVVRLWRNFNHGWNDILHYGKYQLYVDLLRTYQEWQDIRVFVKLHRQNGWNIFEIFFKPPSQLVSKTPVNELLC